jgi:hypothetical protein
MEQFLFLIVTTQIETPIHRIIQRIGSASAPCGKMALRSKESIFLFIEFLVKLGFVTQVTATILPWELFVKSLTDSQNGKTA